MSRVLLVDDDPLILNVYERGLQKHGFEVDTASDGIMATQAVRNHKPDAVVLDLMMPKFDGADFLRFFRAQSDFAQVPVVVLSNAYMNELSEQARRFGVQKVLLKGDCSPTVMAEVLGEILAAQTAPNEKRTSGGDAAGTTDSHATQQEQTAEAERQASGSSGPEEEAEATLRREFLRSATKSQAELRKLSQQFIELHEGHEGGVRLQNLYRKVHFVTASAGMARCYMLALVASAFEAMLLTLQDRPEAITPSVLRTVTVTVGLLDVLFDHAARHQSELPFSGKVLAVDDDPVSNQAVVGALRNTRLVVHTTEDPTDALDRLQQTPYDLVLLDIEMQRMNGFELCRRLRKVPGYERVPVVFVSVFGSADKLVEVTIAGGTDLITKPIFPLELAVKALSHLIRMRISAPA